MNPYAILYLYATGQQDDGMPNFSNLLKSEITRLAKKAVRQSVAPLGAASSAHRKQIAALKRQVGALEKELNRLRRTASPAPNPAKEPAAQAPRFQARGLRSLRAKLGLSAEEFGRLAGVTGQSIYNWEAEKTTPRPAQIQALAAIRSIGKREARARLTPEA